MKRNHYLSVILILILGLTSCKDNYYIENNLHGMWQVISVERLSTGEISESQGQLYYSFQRTMVKLGYKDTNILENMVNYIAHFDLITSDSLGMGYFRNGTTGEGDFVNIENRVPLQSLYKFGIYQDYTTFYKQQSKQELILTSDSARIVLRKY